MQELVFLSLLLKYEKNAYQATTGLAPKLWLAISLPSFWQAVA